MHLSLRHSIAETQFKSSASFKSFTPLDQGHVVLLKPSGEVDDPLDNADPRRQHAASGRHLDAGIQRAGVGHMQDVVHRLSWFRQI